MADTPTTPDPLRRAELRELAQRYIAWTSAGCPVDDEHDTYPSDLWEVYAGPRQVLALLDEIERLSATLAGMRTQAPADAWMWQHDETGRVGFVDPWQVENGWQAQNPRLKLIAPLFRAPPPAQAAEPTDTVREAKNRIAIDGHIDKAFRAILASNEPDAVHAYLVQLVHTSVDIALEGAAAPAPAVAAEPAGEREALREVLADVIATGLRGTYHCNRVREAWSVGTMSEDDFAPVDESDTPGELADAVLAALAAPAAQPEASHLQLLRDIRAGLADLEGEDGKAIASLYIFAIDEALAAQPPADAAAPACTGGPGECAFNRACMYACGGKPPADASALAEEVLQARREWLGRDYDHLPLGEAIGARLDDLRRELDETRGALPPADAATPTSPSVCPNGHGKHESLRCPECWTIGRFQP